MACAAADGAATARGEETGVGPSIGDDGRAAAGVRTSHARTCTRAVLRYVHVHVHVSAVPRVATGYCVHQVFFDLLF